MRNTMERHIQTILLALVIAILAWVGNTIIELRDSSHVMATQVVELKNQVNEINSRFNGYMPRQETEAKFQLGESQHGEINRRLNSLEIEVGTR